MKFFLFFWDAEQPVFERISSPIPPPLPPRNVRCPHRSCLRLTRTMPIGARVPPLRGNQNACRRIVVGLEKQHRDARLNQTHCCPFQMERAKRAAHGPPPGLLQQ